MRRVEFVGDSLAALRRFPESARKEAGVQLHKVQLGYDPSDWKPMVTVGPGVREIRIRDEVARSGCSMWQVLAMPSMCCTLFRRRRSRLRNGILTSLHRGSGKSIEATMKRQSFDNVWDALENSPAEAANMSMRSSLLIAIEQQVRGWGVTQAEAAKRLGITQPRLNDLLRGRITNFSLDTLVKLAGQVGLTVRLEIAEAA
jgi:predicted XRE-type DNA-binding protein